jgi:D-alanyl-D-alanine carboxypeptidase/D-alanyl-D-alanine-endopeptidase (penicillin-binding protein 4)
MRRLAATFAVLVGVLALPAPALALGPQWLRAKLTREMRLTRGHGGVYVADLDSGQPVFALNADVARPPASVEKLYTTSVALLRFGPDATFTTDVLTDADPDADGVLRGDLWLRGGGDPTLTSAGVRALAGEVGAAGITSIHGGVTGDGTLFDALPGSYRTGGRFDTDMGGGLAALEIDRGLKKGRYQGVPALVAARSLARSLRGDHVPVTGQTTAGPTPAGAKVIASLTSPPLRQIVAATNTPSDNFYAETLLKSLGARFGTGGTTAAGAAVVRAQLAGFGVAPRIADGSGLARADLTTPRQVVGLLGHMASVPEGTVLRASLPVPGRTGTLRTRMRGTAAVSHCRAKTGTINFVSALAGYCTTADGHRVAFAFLMSGINVGAARRVQDRMTVALARVSLS